MDLDNFIKIENNTLKRLFSALFLIPIYVFSIISSNYISNFVILFTALILSFEWFEITQNNTHKEKKNVILFCLIIFLNIFLSILTNFFFSIFLTIFFSKLIFLIFFLKKNNFKNLTWLLYGFIYVSLPLIIFFKIKETVDGTHILLWLFLIICSTDIFSYILGNIIKGPKIFPNLSPYKTYSGTILGLIIGSSLGVFFSFIYLNLDIKYLIFFTRLRLIFPASAFCNISFFFPLYSILISFSGLLGDLFISKIKRNFKIKDSSKILPGHGGFLDRYDSISFGLIALFFIQYFL